MKKLLSLVLACLMVVGMLAGSGLNAAADKTDKPVEIVWFIRADEPKNFESVMAAVNEKLLADLNMTLDLLSLIHI